MIESIEAESADGTGCLLYIYTAVYVTEDVASLHVRQHDTTMIYSTPRVVTW